MRPADPLDPLEQGLAEGLRSRDRATFELLVRRDGPVLLRMLRSLLQDEEEARDALQEAFLSAFQGAEGFRGESRVSTWLRRIAFHAGLMRLRKRQRRPERSLEELLPRFEEDGNFARPEPSWQDPLARVEARELRRLVRAALEELPEDYRAAIALRDLEQLDTREAASLLEITPGALKVRLHRARQALRALLAPRIGEALP
jgi:RNA polymerase sigma-70 factor (ECF subfamily)